MERLVKCSCPHYYIKVGSEDIANSAENHKDQDSHWFFQA